MTTPCGLANVQVGVAALIFVTLNPFTHFCAIGAPVPELAFGFRAWPPFTGPAILVARIDRRRGYSYHVREPSRNRNYVRLLLRDTLTYRRCERARLTVVRLVQRQ